MNQATQFHLGVTTLAPFVDSGQQVAVVGAGWAGCAAAVELATHGHHATVFEASRTIGGRARGLSDEHATYILDNGQHILIGAYTETLRLMGQVGVDAEKTLLRMPLTLQFPDSMGLKFSHLPAPLDALWGICSARGWAWDDKASLLRAALRWRWRGFVCAATDTVQDVCASLSPRVMHELIEPLCVSALNTPAQRASGQVFLRVMQDALFTGTGGSHLLLPRTDLSNLFPIAAQRFVDMHNGQVVLGQRVQHIAAHDEKWLVDGALFDQVIIATPPWEAARLVQLHASAQWLREVQALHYESITTVYARAGGAFLAQPMLTLRSDASNPAQFVFDRGQMGHESGLLAFVVSASTGERDAIEALVIAQAKRQLLLDITPVQTIVEKRATFACTPGLQRPAQRIAHGLYACGDYVQGPYPSTLEGAVRSGIGAAQCVNG